MCFGIDTDGNRTHFIPKVTSHVGQFRFRVILNRLTRFRCKVGSGRPVRGVIIFVQAGFGLNPDGNTFMNGTRVVTDGDRLIAQCPGMVADSDAAVTAVIALPQGSPCQGGTTDGNAVLSFREGTIAERHGVRTECPVVIDVGPVFVGIAFQIIAGRFIIIGTYAKIPERQSVIFQLLANFIRNVRIVENTIRNGIRKIRGPARRVHTGDFSAVGNLIKQIFGDFVLDFLFFLLCQCLYICDAAR